MTNLPLVSLTGTQEVSLLLFYACNEETEGNASYFSCFSWQAQEILKILEPKLTCQPESAARTFCFSRGQ